MAVHGAGKVRQGIRGKNLLTLYSLITFLGHRAVRDGKKFILLRSSGELRVVIE